MVALPVLPQITSPTRRSAIAMLVVENVGACNMKCRYCFPEIMWQREGNTPRMPLDRFRDILVQTLSLPTNHTLNIRFAGGEPLLAGVDWLRNAVAIARDVASHYDVRVTFSVQTNGTCVTDEIADFLVANRFEVGVSLDGPPELNERTRGRTHDTLNGLRTLATAFGRPPGVIVTVSQCNALRMADVVDYLDSLGILFFRANLVGAVSAHIAPTAEEWATSRRDILRAIAEKRGRILEYNLEETIRKLRSWLDGSDESTSSGFGCHGMRCPAGDRLLYFAQRGHAHPCPRANVHEDGAFSSHVSTSFRADWNEMNRRLDVEMDYKSCRRCPARIACDFGCHAFNSATSPYFAVNCGASKLFFGALEENPSLLGMVSQYIDWRDMLRTQGGFRQASAGMDVDRNAVAVFTACLRRRMSEWMTSEDVDPAILGMPAEAFEKGSEAVL